MSLSDRLQADMKDAMRAGDTNRRDTLRMAVAAVQSAVKDKRGPLTDEETLDVVGREVKKRRESIEAFTAAGRDDLAAGEEAELAVLTPYLPQQLGADEVRSLAQEAIVATGAMSPRDVGRVMSQLMPRVRGRADGKLVSTIVNEELSRVAAA